MTSNETTIGLDEKWSNYGPLGGVEGEFKQIIDDSGYCEKEISKFSDNQ